VLLIELNGSNLPAGQAGITLGFAPGDGQTIRGLVVNGFATNVGVAGAGLHTIAGCYIGTNAAGSAAVLPSSGSSTGVMVSSYQFSGSFAGIGGTTPADRNVIASGVSIGSTGFPLSSGTIQGNYIGVSADGESLIDPSAAVLISNAGGVIGGSSTAAGNVIAGGVTLQSANGIIVQRNLIGTNATGMVGSLGAKGIVLRAGRDTPTSNNAVLQNIVVSSDSFNAAVVSAFGASSNTFKGNFIGVAADGRTRLGNRPQGIAFLNGASSNTIGGVNPGDGNVNRIWPSAADGQRSATGCGCNRSTRVHEGTEFHRR